MASFYVAYAVAAAFLGGGLYVANRVSSAESRFAGTAEADFAADVLGEALVEFDKAHRVQVRRAFADHAGVTCSDTPGLANVLRVGGAFGDIWKVKRNLAESGVAVELLFEPESVGFSPS